MVPSLVALDKYHQNGMVADWKLASSKDMVFLYS